MIKGKLLLAVFVPGNPIPKQSGRISKGRMYKTEAITTYEATIALIGRSKIINRIPSEAPIWIELIFYRDNRRRVDVGNLEKPVCDALNNVAYKDDSQIVKMELIKYVNKEKPGVAIRVWECDPSKVIYEKK